MFLAVFIPLLMKKIPFFFPFKLVFSFSHGIFNHIMWYYTHTFTYFSTQGSPGNFKLNIR